jgi:hypothetical protein
MRSRKSGLSETWTISDGEPESGQKFTFVRLKTETEMRLVKQLILAVFMTIFLAGGVYAQDDIPKVTLTFSEQCNNFLRHYCVSGNHQRAVDIRLLDLKEKGMTITIKLIRRTARTTPSGTYVPSPAAN